MAVLTSVLMVLTYSVGYLGMTFAGTDSEKIYKDSSTGLTYLLDAEDHTAELHDIEDSDTIVDVNIPAEITVPAGDPNAGKYEVTGINLDGSDHDNVKNFTMPETVKTVKNIKLGSVKDISFPAGVETIDRVSVGKTSGSEEADGSVTFKGSSLKTLRNVSFNNATGTIRLPDGITSISGNFYARKATKLVIPGSIKTVDFQICCNDLKNLTIGEGVTGIKTNWLLPDSKKLETIALPESLKSISGSWTFKGLESLKNITIHKGTELAEDDIGTFNGCSSLESIELPPGFLQDGKVPDSMFEGCESLKTVTFDSPVSKVGRKAFYCCYDLNKINGMDKLGEIGPSAFMGTPSLSGNFDLSNIDSIPNSAFSGSGITGVEFSDELTSIGNDAFSGTELTEVAFPDSLTRIGSEAFSYTKIKMLKLPDSLTEIGRRAFYRMNDLTEVHIGSRINKLDDYEFANCKALEKVEIGSKDRRAEITEISEDAFRGVTNLTKENTIIHAAPSDVDVKSMGNLTKDQITFTETDPAGPKDDEIGGEDSKSLQAAIDDALKAAGENETAKVKVKKDIYLKGTIVVRENRKLELTSEEGATISAAEDANLDGGRLFKVMKDGSLTLSNLGVTGMLSPSVIAENSGLIDVEGELRLEKGSSVHDVKLQNSNSAAIRVSGGKLYMGDDSEICGVNRLKRPYAVSTGSVLLDDGSSMEMTGGSIHNNTCSSGHTTSTLVSSSGIFVTGGSKLIISGGEICDNTANAAPAIYIKDGKVTMSGGSVHNNTVEPSRKPVAIGTSYNPGAIFVNTHGEFSMKGDAEVSNNTGIYGGGITVYKDGTFTMENGIVRNNIASCGGGIYTFSNNTTFKAGLIEGNHAKGHGGGIYVEGNDWDPSDSRAGYAVARFSGSTLITGNKATRVGGGFWACPTARAIVRDYGLAVFDNDAVTGDKDHAGDDFAIEAVEDRIHRNIEQNFGDVTDREIREYLDKGNTISEKSLGGDVTYYNDGTLGHAIGDSQSGGLTRDSERYSEKNHAVVEHVSGDLKGTHALKAIASGSVKKTAESRATLVIRNNSADDGGGIGMNGGAYFEEGNPPKNPPENPPETKMTQVSVKKVWENDEAGDRPESISVQLLRDGIAYGGTVSLSEDNDWSYKWKDLDASHKWSVKEVSVPDGYNSAIDHDGDSWIITNTKKKPEKPDIDDPEPVTPDKPDKPKKKNGGNGSTSEKKTVSNTKVEESAGHYVRTGDTDDVLIYSGLFAAAAAGAVLLSIRRRKKADKAGR